jgi:hypothetical protein
LRCGPFESSFSDASEQACQAQSGVDGQLTVAGRNDGHVEIGLRNLCDDRVPGEANWHLPSEVNWIKEP